MLEPIKSIVFAHKHKKKLSLEAFFYLLNGGNLPPLSYSTKEILPHKSYYLQSYLYKGKFKMRVFESYFKAPFLEGLLLATKRFKKDELTTIEDFYLESLESLAYYA